jgi:coiled-coil domain-containing protein 130
MSSLAAARADNFYQPPDWDPSKESRNKFHNSHGALGNRARKLHEGILIIRFEMPFHVWCDGCGHLIGRGVRFNAEKKQIGTYHSTKIWSFTMRAPCCKQKIEVHTDPRNADYVVVSGGKKKAEAAGEDEAEAGGRVAVDPRAESRPTDPIALLESKEEDKLKAVDARKMLISIHQQSSSRFKSDVDNNRELRRAMRSARREEQTRDQRREQLGLPERITLAPETKMDRLRAAAIDFGGSGLSVGAAGWAAVGEGGISKHTRAWKHDRKRIASSSIFSGSAVVAASAAGRGGIQKRAPPPSNQHHHHPRHGAVASKNKNNKSQRIDTGTKLKLSEPHKR